jgi:hypothetical protein
MKAANVSLAWLGGTREDFCFSKTTGDYRRLGVREERGRRGAGDRFKTRKWKEGEMFA